VSVVNALSRILIEIFSLLPTRFRWSYFGGEMNECQTPFHAKIHHQKSITQPKRASLFNGFLRPSTLKTFMGNFFHFFAIKA
jgi:hypothetical protein